MPRRSCRGIRRSAARLPWPHHHGHEKAVMHIALKKVLAVGVLLLASGFAVRDAQAQRYGEGGPRQVYCASNDSRGSRCQMPWRDSVLAQQMSRAACIEGRTWGSDPYSVWIKGGCRGNFSDARAYGW